LAEVLGVPYGQLQWYVIGTQPGGAHDWHPDGGISGIPAFAYRIVVQLGGGGGGGGVQFRRRGSDGLDCGSVSYPHLGGYVTDRQVRVGNRSEPQRTAANRSVCGTWG
jgi:hypothetical protein